MRSANFSAATATFSAVSSNSSGGSSAPEAGLVQPLARLGGDHLDQVAQLQHAAGAGLERLAVGPVHGAEADVLQRALGGVAGQVGGAEHHLEMVGLALVDDIERSGRDRSSRRRSRMVARSVVPYMAEPSDETTSSGGSSRLSSLRATRTISAPWSSTSRPLARSSATIGSISGVDVALALPQVEIDAERVEVALQGRAGDAGRNARHSSR